MHLPLEDLLDGAMRTLRTEILPAIDSRRARGQLHCVLDLLDNLRDRVAYKPSLFEDEARSAAEALEAVGARLSELGAREAANELATLAAAAPPTPPRERAEALRVAVARAVVLVARTAPTDPASRAPLDRHLLDQTIRDVMLLKPPPLDEISKG